MISGVCAAGLCVCIKAGVIKTNEINDYACTDPLAPFGDISDKRIRCTNVGIIPAVFEMDKEECQKISYLLNNFKWTEIPLDSPRGDGESFILYVYDKKESFSLEFLPEYNTIKYSSESGEKKYTGISIDSYCDLQRLSNNYDKHKYFLPCKKDEAYGDSNKVIFLNYYLAWKDVMLKDGFSEDIFTKDE